MFGIPRLYILLSIFLAGLLAGSVSAWKVQGWRQAALEHARQAQQQRDTQKRMDRVDEAATSHEDFKAKEEIRYVDRIKVVRQIIDRPVYRNQCLDEPGRLLINSAAAGSDPGQPAPAVPAAAKP